jgi:rhamnosyltransferase
VTRVFAVLVSYNPRLDQLARVVGRVRPQVAELLVVDNGSENAPAIAALLRQHGARLEALPANLGLGAAHNRGIARARDAGADAALLLDQDSVPEPDMVVELERALRGAAEQGLAVGAVGARYTGAHAGDVSEFVRFGRLKFRRMPCAADTPWVRADFLISSGTLVPMPVLEAVGGMDESLFIDHVDTEWFLRAADRGYVFVGACAARMSHGLGERTQRLWLGRWRQIPRHRPFRYYYIFRNSMLLYRRRYAPARWMVNDIVRLFLLVLFVGLPALRDGSLGMMLKGLRDGWRGVSGPTVAPS